MSLKNLLYWSYWFSQPYAASGLVFKVWLGIFLALTFFGIVALSLRSQSKEEPTRKALTRLSSCLIVMGLFGLVWLWLRQGSVVFLAWRFWLLVWLVIFVIWLARVIYYLVWRLPKIKVVNSERELKNKYLPGR